MPVICPIQFTVLSKEEFHRRDYGVMAHVFAAHNALGRFCDERIYQRDVASRLQVAGLCPVLSEVPLTVLWRDFRKRYYLDLVVQDALLYDCKAVAALSGEHKAQLLNYALLAGVPTAKLLNFRTPQVEFHFVSTRLTLDIRRQVECQAYQWQEVSPRCAGFRAALTEILSEFGAFLDLALYEEMLTWHLGGEAKVLQQVEVLRDGLNLGSQRCRLIAPDVAFKLTAHTENLEHVQKHLQRFLDHTPLRAIQWANLDHSRLQLVTLIKSK
jgi:GxxExxY protein